MMFFDKKKDKTIRCQNCNSSLDKKFSFCPYCGDSLVDEKAEARDFGFLGRNDLTTKKARQDPFLNMGMTDKILNSLVSNMIKSLDKQFKQIERTEFDGNADVEQLPNGIKIKIGVPQSQQKPQRKVLQKKNISEEQLKKMSNLPRTPAKTKIRRLSDKIVYELTAPGVESTEDVFISKLESGYEIKAIGKKKVYVNSLPVSLPLRGFSLADNKLLVEFKTDK